MTIERFLFEGGRKEVRRGWNGTFQEYFEKAVKHPEITQLSIQRIYRMIMSHGTRTETIQGKERTIYQFFEGKMFGAEAQIEQIMLYLKAASMGLDIKKRVLLLLGPPGGGKSQILSMIKKGLATYSTTDKGAIFAIEGCPVREDPMHLLPEEERQEVWEKYRIKIEGKLCPVCRFRYETEWNKNLNHVPVERVYVNEETRVGIGTFAPSEENNMEELIGSEDLSKVDYYGNAGDVRAYAFNGELHSANRGIMEFIEILKAKNDFLHVLLTLAEEQMFKSPRIPLQYVDEALIAHTNEGEFLRFISQKENEAVIDRMYIVRMPYNMEVQHEELIYHYALETKLVVKGVRVHPGAIRLASMFAIRTREHSDPLRHGMSGLSPRFILNVLALSLVRTRGSEVTPKAMLQHLAEQVYRYPVLNLQQREQYLTYLEELRQNIHVFERVRMEDVQKIKKKKDHYLDIYIGHEE